MRSTPSGSVDADGKITWASSGRASSSYASRQQSHRGHGVNGVPRWSGLRSPRPASPRDRNALETRVVEGRGFPHSRAVGRWTNTSAAATLPLRPIWRGFVIDILLFALLAAGAAWL